MRKSLWIILLLMFVTSVAPNAHADSYTPTFTCTGPCVSVPTAPDVSFPSPTTITETWDTYVAAISLPSQDTYSDDYVWTNTSSSLNGQELIIMDNTNGIEAIGFLSIPTISVPIEDIGTLSFAPVATPEPSSIALMLTGVGLVFVMRKRIGQALPQAK